MKTTRVRFQLLRSYEIDYKNLDELIICYRCNEIHKVIELEPCSQAYCNRCNAMLYGRSDNKIIDKLLAISISAILFFILANSFTIIKMDIMDSYETLNIPSMIFTLFKMKYYIVGIFITLFIFLIPLFSILLYIIVAILLKTKIYPNFTKEILILISTISHWKMLDIFLISVLVSIVKLIGSFDISVGTSFYSLTIFILLEIYITSHIKIFNLWQIYNRIYSNE